MPDWRAHVRRHLPALAVGPERENEIVAELALQLDQAYADALARGASDAEAQSQAAAQFRDWDRLAREVNRAERSRGPRLFAGVLRDARYGGRYLLRNTGFAAVAILTLGFGIGASVAVFSLVDALVLRSLSYPEPQWLMAIETRRVQQPEIEPWTSPPDFFDLRERTRAFSSLAAIDPVWNLVLTGRGEAEQLTALFTSAELFPMLGVKAELGRTFSAREDIRTAPVGVTVLSDSFWQRRFGGRRDILRRGKAVRTLLFSLERFQPSNQGTRLSLVPAGTNLEAAPRGRGRQQRESQMGGHAPLPAHAVEHRHLYEIQTGDGAE